MQRGEIDGVPVFWTPWEHQPQRVGIRFRVGVADEPLALRGVTHLIEHLSLFRLGETPYMFNGTVSSASTTFTASGRAHEIHAFLERVTHELADLPYDRLDRERRVLDVEESGRGAYSRARFHQLRFGAASYGLMIKRELARHLLEPETIERWRTDWFTRGNAVIWMTGEPPEGLQLPLPDGPRQPPPVSEPLPTVQFPTYALGTDGEIAIGLLGPSSDAFQAALYIARRRLVECLRRERGVAYGVVCDSQSLGYGRMHGALSLDCLNEHAPLALDRMMGILNDLAADGPTDDELEFERDAFARMAEAMDSPIDEIESAARDELAGSPVESMDDWRARVEALTARDCAEALAEALPTAILDIPPQAESAAPDGFTHYEVRPPQLPKPDGPSFRELDETDCPVRPCTYTVGEEHLHLQAGDGSEPDSIPYSEVVGVIGEGARSVRIGTRDERRFEISAFKFPEAGRLVELLRERIPPELWLPPLPAMEVVDEVAERDLDTPELVTEELQDLAHDLREEERPLAFATDALDGSDAKPSLVGVTSERLIYIYADCENSRNNIWNETERGEISEPEADADDEGAPRLSFTIDGQRQHIYGIDSPESAERLARALRDGAGGKPAAAPAGSAPAS
jgi:predicted Zn-dependent peptidase